jgi:hypothetical protein
MAMHRFFKIGIHIQGVFEVEVFFLTCDSMRCSKEFQQKSP